MPSSWAQSGARLPIVIKCDFLPDQRLVVPKENVIRFTGPEGEVVKRIEPGEFSLENNRNLQFTLTFPQEISRRDVILDPCTITCEGLLYSKSDLKILNDAFYKAREETWKAGATMNEIARRNDAPKKWNFETKQWQERYPREGLLSQMTKRVKLFQVQQEQEKENQKRPNPKDLSLDFGPFPGVDGDVFIQKSGTIKIRGKKWGDGAIIGTWDAEPINDKPVSYYN
jgi:hypothetical protein